MVQPRVNAAGNQATTTACLPLKSDSWYVFPSVACSLKFGAWSPTLRSTVWAIAVMARPSTRLAVNNARITQPPGLLERVSILPISWKARVFGFGRFKGFGGSVGPVRVVKRKDVKDSPADANPGGERSAAPFVPRTTSIRVLSAEAQKCRGCDLYKTATQVVFGAGPSKARIVFVGEQPGDHEDRQGIPFVGPAGAMLDKALEDAGIPRSEVYLTNAVKHFKWEPRGKRRIHKKPRMSEIKACRPWLEAELRAIKPRIVVCLGAVAAQSIMGSQFKLMQNRGKLLPAPLGPAGSAGR